MLTALKRNREIWYSLIAIAVVTAIYALAYLPGGRFPAASGLIGHGIGVAGFVLMLATETLYSLRKRSTDARWGSMSDWLTFHMVTGLVGPYMVLLHTAMRFQGLAGVALLLTAVVVASGLVGRYIYSRVPRVIDDAAAPVDGYGGDAGDRTTFAPASRDAESERLAQARRALAKWHSVHVPLTWTLFAFAFMHAGAALFYATLQR